MLVYCSWFIHMARGLNSDFVFQFQIVFNFQLRWLRWRRRRRLSARPSIWAHFRCSHQRALVTNYMYQMHPFIIRIIFACDSGRGGDSDTNGSQLWRLIVGGIVSDYYLLLLPLLIHIYWMFWFHHVSQANIVSGHNCVLLLSKICSYSLKIIFTRECVCGVSVFFLFWLFIHWFNSFASHFNQSKWFISKCQCLCFQVSYWGDLWMACT